jgi:DNA adenine methylase
LAPWYGSKRSIAKAIIEQIGKHKFYWEPFCGSMAVLMQKPRCEMETVNDLNGDLINLARIIQSEQLADQLYQKLSRTLFAEQFFNESKERWRSDERDFFDEPDIDRAFDFFIVSWMGLNGISGTMKYDMSFAMRWKGGGGQGGRRFASVIDSIPAWHQRIKELVIVRKDAFYLFENISDDVDTVIYCDPPYLTKSCKYQYDFESPDHGRLADALKRFKKARVFLSYYDHPKLKELYPDWQRLAIGTNRTGLKNAAKANQVPAPSKTKNTELLLLNHKTEKHLF